MRRQEKLEQVARIVRLFEADSRNPRMRLNVDRAGFVMLKLSCTEAEALRWIKEASLAGLDMDAPAPSSEKKEGLL